MEKVTIMMLGFSAFSAAGGQLLFRVGARGRMHWQEFINMPLFLGLLLYLVGTVIWIYVLSRENIVNVYPFTALTFILVYLGGFFLMDERVTLAGFAGMGLVLCGLYMIVKFNA